MLIQYQNRAPLKILFRLHQCVTLVPIISISNAILRRKYNYLRTSFNIFFIIQHLFESLLLNSDWILDSHQVGNTVWRNKFDLALVCFSYIWCDYFLGLLDIIGVDGRLAATGLKVVDSLDDKLVEFAQKRYSDGAHFYFIIN